MHPREVRFAAVALLAQGLNDCEVARRVGVPRTTVRDWRRARPADVPHRPRCWRPALRTVTFTEPDYAELLGLYLGDGCLSPAGRVMRLRISLDAKYTTIVAESRALLSRCFPTSSVGLVSADAGATVVLSLYSSHLPCLFPQHGPGKKHARSIVLEPWQEACVAAAPWGFLRGCIRSDGCTFVNRTGPYRYLSFDFCNRSHDIRALFAHACDLVDVEYRMSGDRIRMNRRASVARLVANVGVKS